MQALRLMPLSHLECFGGRKLIGVRRLCVLAIAAILSACASQPAPKPDESRVGQFAAGGYPPKVNDAFETTRVTWEEGERSVDLAVTVPTGAGPFPLIIYLPTLGEDRSSGEIWRSAWASHGYAVISLQPLHEDAAVWSSPRARAGEFSAIAQDRFSSAAMVNRLSILHWAMREVIRRHDRNEPPFGRIDLTRAVFAGYDLGAYTAMVAAGEAVSGAVPPPSPIPIAAVVALSPFAASPGRPADGRYAEMRLPVLSVTGDEDEDPLNLVSSPAWRKAPFQHMPAGGKYLATLSRISHETLGGGAIKLEAEAEQSSAYDESGDDKATPAGRTSGRKRSGGLSDSDSRRRARAAASLAEAQRTLTTQAICATIVKDVTSAFLDAYVKGDIAAKTWLDTNASGWIREQGEIKVR